MNIQQSFLKLISFLILISCSEADVFENYKKSEILTKSNDKLKVILAISDKEQEKGLSNIKPDQFADNQVMLFTAKETKLRQFWMPETFFNLDIVFLSSDLYIIDIDRNVPKHPTRYPRHQVPLSKSVFCTHVLEIKSSSPLAKKIKIGEFLKWNGTKSLSQILQDTH